MNDNTAIVWSPTFTGYQRMPFRIDDGNYHTGIQLYNSSNNVYTKLGVFTDIYGQGNNTYSIFVYPNAEPKIGDFKILTQGNTKTINGYSIYGNGNINISGGGASGSYINITGGSLNINTEYNAYLSMIRGGSNSPTGTNFGVLLTLPYRGALGNTKPDFACQLFMPNGDEGAKPNGLFYRTSTSYSWNNWMEVLNTAGGQTINGTLTTTDNITISGYDKAIKVSSSSANEVFMFGASASGYIYGSGNGTYLRFINGMVGVRTSAPAYAFHVSGDIYATGGVTTLSDARHKTIIQDTQLSVEQIAGMPAVVYRWNDGREDKDLHVGSIAQDWQRVLPQVVLTANDAEHTLSMQYGVAALISAITIARKVVNHEQRLTELEKENAQFRAENAQLRAEISKLKAA